MDDAAGGRDRQPRKKVIRLSFGGFVAAGMLVAGIHGVADPAGAQTGASAGDSAWFEDLARAEALLGAATTRGAADSAARAAVVEQIRGGAHGLRALLAASSSADTLIAGSLTPIPPPPPRQGQWGNRFIRATSVIAVTSNLVNIAASLRGASHETRLTLAYVGGSAGGVGALFSLLRPRPAPPPVIDPDERIRTVGRELLLRDTYAETSRAAQAVATELQAISAGSAATGEQVVALARRYASAFRRASAVLDLSIAHAASTARSCGEYPGFSGAARGRMTALSEHLDRIVASWQARRAMFERSERNAIAFLVLADRP